MEEGGLLDRTPFVAFHPICDGAGAVGAISSWPAIVDNFLYAAPMMKNVINI